MVVTEGRPDSTGLNMANALSKMKVPCTVVLDSAVAFALEALKWVHASAIKSRPDTAFSNANYTYFACVAHRVTPYMMYA